MKWRWHYQKCSMWCWKICRNCWYRGKCRQKMRARGETYSQWKAFFTVRFSNTVFKMGHFRLLYIVETQKFHLEHCKIKADFTLNVLLVRISVLWECFICKMLDHIALLRAIKKKKKEKKKKPFPDRPTVPQEGHLWTSKLFFFLGLTETFGWVSLVMDKATYKGSHH